MCQWTGARLHELDEYAAGVLRVDEVDAAAGRPVLGGVVEQAHAALTQRRRDGVDVGDPVRELLDALAVAREELGDRRFVAQRSEQLDAGAGVAHGEHRLADALFLVDLLMDRTQAEGVGVELECVVEVGHGDADVVDGEQQMVGHEGV